MRKFLSVKPKGKWAVIRLVGSLVILVVLAVIALIPGGATNFRQVAMKVIPTPKPHILELSGNSFQRGEIHGKEMKWAIRLLDKIYIRYFAPDGKLAVFRQRAEQVFQSIDPGWSEELRGMCQATGVEENILMLGNSFLDLGLNASGCRQIHINTNGKILHSHNLDWDNLGGVGNYLVTIYRSSGKPGAYRTVHLAFPGMIGVLDIINEHGIAMSFNQIGFGDKNTLPKIPVFIAMREIAESCRDFESARQRLLDMPAGMPFLIGLSDAKSGQMAIFERDLGSGVKEITPDGPYLTADNIARFNSRHTNPLLEQVKATAPRSTEDLIALLRNPKILLGCNIYSVIFDFADNTMYLASGEVPAAIGKYRKFTLF